MAVIDVARELIRKYLKENPKRSITSMARAAAVPPSTARAILSGDIQETSDDKLFALLLTFMPMDEVTKVFEEHSDKSPWLYVTKKQRAETLAFENGFDWQNQDPCIFAFGCLIGGSTRKVIQRRYGEGAGKRIDAMLEAGLLKEINNRIIIPADIHLTDVKDVLANIKLHVQGWTVDELETGGFYQHRKDGLSFEGRDKMKEATRKWIAEILEIKDQYKGSDCAMVLSVVTSFIEEGRE